MKVKKYKEKDFGEMMVRAFSTKWNDEYTEVLFRISWGKNLVSADISLNKRQIRSLVNFLEDWLEHG